MGDRDLDLAQEELGPCDAADANAIQTRIEPVCPPQGPRDGRNQAANTYHWLPRTRAFLNADHFEQLLFGPGQIDRAVATPWAPARLPIDLASIPFRVTDIKADRGSVVEAHDNIGAPPGGSCVKLPQLGQRVDLEGHVAALRIGQHLQFRWPLSISAQKDHLTRLLGHNLPQLLQAEKSLVEAGQRLRILGGQRDVS